MSTRRSTPCRPVGRAGGAHQAVGTGHAVLSCREAVSGSSRLIRADDFYGRTSFQTLGHYLTTAADRDGVYDYCMLAMRCTNIV